MTARQFVISIYPDAYIGKSRGSDLYAVFGKHSLSYSTAWKQTPKQAWEDAQNFINVCMLRKLES